MLRDNVILFVFDTVHATHAALQLVYLFYYHLFSQRSGSLLVLFSCRHDMWISDPGSRQGSRQGISKASKAPGRAGRASRAGKEGRHAG